MNGNQHPAVAEASAREDQIQIPETVRVSCPIAENKWRSMINHCPECQHFHGLKDRFPGSKIALVNRYSVRCSGGIVERQMIEIEA